MRSLDTVISQEGAKTEVTSQKITAPLVALILIQQHEIA